MTTLVLRLPPIGPELIVQPILEVVDESKDDHKQNDTPTDGQEVYLHLLRHINVFKVQTEVGGEEEEREKEYSNDCENENGFDVILDDDCEFVLFDGAELKEPRTQVNMLAPKGMILGAYIIQGAPQMVECAWKPLVV